jgi:hypothetical protein
MSKPTRNEFKIEQTTSKTDESLDQAVPAGAKKMLAAVLDAAVATYPGSPNERDG